jgi:hypothetical protein
MLTYADVCCGQVMRKRFREELARALRRHRNDPLVQALVSLEKPVVSAVACGEEEREEREGEGEHAAEAQVWCA